MACCQLKERGQPSVPVALIAREKPPTLELIGDPVDVVAVNLCKNDRFVFSLRSLEIQALCALELVDQETGQEREFVVLTHRIR